MRYVTRDRSPYADELEPSAGVGDIIDLLKGSIINVQVLERTDPTYTENTYEAEFSTYRFSGKNLTRIYFKTDKQMTIVYTAFENIKFLRPLWSALYATGERPHCGLRDQHKTRFIRAAGTT